MSQPKKRFGRSRDAQEDAQQFTLPERDRELAALAAEILPRNSAAASFEREATRHAGSSSVAARDAGTDTELARDTPSDATGPVEAEDTTGTAGRRTTRTTTASPRRTKGRTGAGAKSAADTGEPSSKDSASTTTRHGAGAQDTPAGAEPTPAELKQQRKRERQAQRREAQAAKAEVRERRATDLRPTPLWYKIVMIGLMIVGLLWIITFYLFQGLVPIPGIGQWNLFIGLAFMLSGLIMTTRWR